MMSASSIPANAALLSCEDIDSGAIACPLSSSRRNRSRSCVARILVERDQQGRVHPEGGERPIIRGLFLLFGNSTYGLSFLRTR